MTKVIVSCGDVNGIGLEVWLKALRQYMLHTESSTSFHHFHSLSWTVVIAPSILREYCAKLVISDVVIEENSGRIGFVDFDIIPTQSTCSVEFGVESVASGAVAFESLQKAAQACVERQFDGLLTLPVSKKVLHAAGSIFPGQTELIADVCGSAAPMMILLSGAEQTAVKVALATIHIPLARVPFMISQELITERIVTLYKSLQQDFGIQSPHIAVLGVNPHAGEDGDIGTEERDIIHPAIEQARYILSQQNIRTNSQNTILAGAFPADGFFAHGEYRAYDGILAMYHDQGLIPLKLLAAMSANGAGVNFSAGLPIVRTSPDHGTAFGIAGKNQADERGTLQAILALRAIVAHRRNFVSF